jgi:glyceraldehyde 3-phosphate dehydrogenase
MVKVGINGFGRIGRNVLRAALGRSDFEVVAINDLTDSKTLAHLLKYDSLSGRLAASVEAGENQLLLDGRPIHVFSERDPGAIPWKSVGVDVVIEATGFFCRQSQGGSAHHPWRRQASDYLCAGKRRRYYDSDGR